MTHTPRVSIGLGVYNGGNFLKPTLTSILSQTFTDFELIVSDNASSDGTEDVCREFAALDSRVRYSRNPVNIGLNNNFNRVFRLSSGQYFRWSAGDDLFAPTSLEECVNVLDRQPEVALCYPKTVLIDAAGDILGSYADNLDLRVPGATDRFRSVLENIGLVNVQYGLIRADILRRSSLFGAYIGSDIVLIAELALYGSFWEIPHELFFRRIHDGATSALKHKPWEISQQYWNATTKSGPDFYYSTHRYYNLVSILRSPIRAVDKLRLACFLCGWVFRSKGTYIKELQNAGGQLLKRLTPERNP